MTKITISKNGKKIGRPRLGPVTLKLAVRITDDMEARIKQWAAANFCSYGDAVRELIDKGIKPNG